MPDESWIDAYTTSGTLREFSRRHGERRVAKAATLSASSRVSSVRASRAGAHVPKRLHRQRCARPAAFDSKKYGNSFKHATYF